MEEIKSINKRVVNGYTIGNVLPTLAILELPSVQKLMYLQITPDKAIKTRKIGNTEVPYVEIGYVERALNFVSNFNWGGKIIDKWFIQYETINKKWEKKKVYESWVQCEFYIDIDKNRIERSAFGSWISHENPAVSQFAVYQSALSIATKAFADTLGIWSDKKDMENAGIKKAREELQEATLWEVTEWFSTSQIEWNKI